MALIQIGRVPKGPKKAKSGIPKPPFSTGFIRFFDMVECRVRLIYKPNAFLIILEPFCDFASKSSKFHRFYKVFSLTFPDASKRCFTNVFLMFCKVGKRTQLLLINLMLFWSFWGPFPQKGAKVFKFSRFYKGFRNAFLHFEKRGIRQVL